MYRESQPKTNFVSYLTGTNLFNKQTPFFRLASLSFGEGWGEDLRTNSLINKTNCL